MKKNSVNTAIIVYYIFIIITIIITGILMYYEKEGWGWLIFLMIISHQVLYISSGVIISENKKDE